MSAGQTSRSHGHTSKIRRTDPALFTTFPPPGRCATRGKRDLIALFGSLNPHRGDVNLFRPIEHARRRNPKERSLAIIRPGRNCGSDGCIGVWWAARALFHTGSRKCHDDRLSLLHLCRIVILAIYAQMRTAIIAIKAAHNARLDGPAHDRCLVCEGIRRWLHCQCARHLLAGRAV